MKSFVFPKAEELYSDAHSASSRHSALIHAFLGGYTGFGKEVADKAEELCKGSGGTIEYRDYGYEYVTRLHERKAAQNLNDFITPIAKIADRYTDQNIIGSFPPSRLASYTIGEEDDVKTWIIDYFEQMGKNYIGRTGWIMYAYNECRKNLKGKIDHSPGFLAIYLGTALLMLLCCGNFIPLMPNFMQNLFIGSIGAWARLGVGVVMILVSLLTFMFTESDGGFIKFLGNGWFCFINAFMSVAVTVTLYKYSNEPAYPFFFWPFAIYYVLISLGIVFANKKRNKKIRKQHAEAKAAICKLTEENIEFLHRSICFHTLWWKHLHGNDPLPPYVVNMKNTKNGMLKDYKQFAG